MSDIIREDLDKYFDEDGIERTLAWMIKNRPGWTRTRIAFYKENFQSSDEKINKLTNMLDSRDREIVQLKRVYKLVEEAMRELTK